MASIGETDDAHATRTDCRRADRRPEGDRARGATPMTLSAEKFDASRATEYAEQSRIGLAGYDACHELAACLLSGVLGPGGAAEILVCGVGGTAQEILVGGRLEPHWRFTGVDPSAPMLDSARAAVDAAGLAPRTALYAGGVEDLPEERHFDAATLIGVLHHLPGDPAKLEILRAIARRLKPGAPLILACNRGRYREKPMFLAAWANRWRMAGTPKEKIETKMGRILEGADPSPSDREIEALLAATDFGASELFFSSLFWGGWIARRSDQVVP